MHSSPLSRMVASPSRSASGLPVPHPVQCRVEVKVYPVCPHCPQHLLDLDQQIKFADAIQPAIQQSVERISSHPSHESEQSWQHPAMVSVGTQTLPFTVPGGTGRPLQPLHCQVPPESADLEYALPTPLQSSTPRLTSRSQTQTLHQLALHPDWEYLHGLEEVTPPISLVIAQTQALSTKTHPSPPLLSPIDPIIPVWTPSKYPDPHAKQAPESIHSGPDTDRGLCQHDTFDSNDLDAALTTPPLFTQDNYQGDHDSLPSLTPQDVATSLCALSSSHEDTHFDMEDLEPLFDFS